MRGDTECQATARVPFSTMVAFNFVAGSQGKVRAGCSCVHAYACICTSLPLLAVLGHGPWGTALLAHGAACLQLLRRCWQEHAQQSGTCELP
jgi:hypothetical protein